MFLKAMKHKSGVTIIGFYGEKMDRKHGRPWPIEVHRICIDYPLGYLKCINNYVTLGRGSSSLLLDRPVLATFQFGMQL